MQDKKMVITASHVCFVCGLIGTLFVFISMGISWVRFGTPILNGIGIFQSPIMDTLFLLALVIGPIIWGSSELRKNKHVN